MKLDTAEERTVAPQSVAARTVSRAPCFADTSERRSRDRGDIETLDAAERAVETEMRAVLERYCAGPLAEIGVGALASGGSRRRSRLVLELASALDLSLARAVPFAAACELLHNGTLVHDDLQDGDKWRRGTASVWARHGAAAAINVGDTMLIAPYAVIGAAGYDASTQAALSEAVARRSLLTAQGQALEQLCTERGRGTVSEVIEAARGKTGQFFALPIEGVAHIAKYDPALSRAAADAALPLGVLYQIADDLLDLYGDKGRGRAGNDLREGKWSTLVALHVAQCPGDTERLAALLAAPRAETSMCEVAWAIERFAVGGTTRIALRLAEEALNQIASSDVLERIPVIAREVRSLGGTLLDRVMSLVARSLVERSQGMARLHAREAG